MKPDDLAAAAKLWEENRGETIVVLETHRAVLRAAATLANAYLAREADDAKPVDRDWLVSVLGREPVVIDGAALWLKRPSHCSTRITLTIDGFVGYLHGTQGDHGVVLDTRKKLRAFLELADWPTNETGGE